MQKIDYMILIILYIISIFVIVTYLIIKNKKKTCSPIHNGFIVSVLFYYLLIPVFVLLNIDDLVRKEQSIGKYGNNTFERFITSNNWGNFLYSFLLIIISIFLFIFFYNISKKKNNSRKLVLNEEKSYRNVQRVMLFTFWIGLVSLIVFFGSFGGIRTALSYAEKMRNMSSSLVEEIGGVSALFKITARLVTVTPFLIIYLNNKREHSKAEYNLIFVVSLIASLLFYIYNAGRTPIILFTLCFFYYLICNKIKKPWTTIIFIGVIALPLLDILDSLFIYFNSGVWLSKETNYLNYVYQFSVPYKNTLILTDLNNCYGLRWFTDFFKAFLDFLPGVGFEPPYANLSLYVRGYDWKNLGGIPTDFITFSHMQLSYIGVIIMSALMGYLSQIVDYKLSLVNNSRIKDLFIGILTLYFFSLNTSFDPFSIIKGQFILIFIIYIIIKTSKREDKQNENFIC